MIKSIMGKANLTPRQLAKEIFFHDLATITDYALEKDEHRALTQKERESVQRQLNKLHDRILKLINHRE